ncbi:hypothetical protein ABI59_08360 [Acidobacteria bacterium Mor1]|nr:hypothetical protein ABI59_08360 [Acidobacteria bacterium Mor1]
MKQTLRTRFGLGAAIAALVLLATPALALGTPEGTPISNTATVNYEDDNGNPLSATSNTVTTIVAQVAAVDVDPDNASSADPGDTVTYLHTVTNNGNGDDTIDLAAVSSQGWTVTIYLDDGDGVFEGGADDTVASDTGLLSADGSVDIWIEVVVPAGTADGTVDTTTVTGTSQFDSGVSESATDTTTVDSPDISVVKSVSPTGDQPPGTTLTYTMVVTNNGNAAASAVVLTDAVPANTTYVAGSITQDAGSLTDGGGDDNGDFGATTAGTVTVTIGTLAASGGSTTITFQVTID